MSWKSTQTSTVTRTSGYLEALELLCGVLVLPQAGVEDEEFCVPQPDLQLFNSGLQLFQQRIGERGEGRARVLQEVSVNLQQGRLRIGRLGPLGATSRMFRQDFLGRKHRRRKW